MRKKRILSTYRILFNNLRMNLVKGYNKKTSETSQFLKSMQEKVVTQCGLKQSNLLSILMCLLVFQTDTEKASQDRNAAIRMIPAFGFKRSYSRCLTTWKVILPRILSGLLLEAYVKELPYGKKTHVLTHSVASATAVDILLKSKYIVTCFHQPGPWDMSHLPCAGGCCGQLPQHNCCFMSALLFPFWTPLGMFIV